MKAKKDSLISERCFRENKLAINESALIGELREIRILLNDIKAIQLETIHKETKDK